MLLLAFCSRALIPSGFMPGPAGLVICNGYTHAAIAASGTTAHPVAAMATVDMDMAGMDMPAPGAHSSKDGGNPGHDGSTPCPFAIAATAMASGHPAIFVVALRFTAEATQLPPESFVPSGTIVPNRLPRGPPAVA